VYISLISVYAGQAGVRSFSNRVPTLCNQVLSHLLADILQTLHSCHEHIEDVRMFFLEVFEHFSKNLHLVELNHFSSMFCVHTVPTL
jgi:hypothetical protein